VHASKEGFLARTGHGYRYFGVNDEVRALVGGKVLHLFFRMSARHDGAERSPFDATEFRLLPGADLDRGDFGKLSAARLPHQNLDLFLAGRTPVLRRERLNPGPHLLRTFRKTLAQVLDALDGKPVGLQPVCFIAERFRPSGKFAIEYLPQILRGPHERLGLQGEPVLTRLVPGRVRDRYRIKPYL